MRILGLGSLFISMLFIQSLGLAKDGGMSATVVDNVHLLDSDVGTIVFDRLDNMFKGLTPDFHWQPISNRGSSHLNIDYKALDTAPTHSPLDATDDVVIVGVSSNNLTVNLPKASSFPGKVYEIQLRSDSSLARYVQLSCYDAGDIIDDGATTATSTILSTPKETIRVMADGTNNIWRVLERKTTTEWVSYTPATPSGFNSWTTVETFWRRVGDSIEIHGKLKPATSTGGNEAQIALPANIKAADTTKISSIRVCGVLSRDENTGADPYLVLIQAGANYMNVGNTSTFSTKLTAANFSNGVFISFTCVFPAANDNSTTKNWRS